MTAELVKLTIDGEEIQAEAGTLLWEAANAHGIEIPIFCYHTKLGPVGACRTCLVEQVGNAKGPITACSTPVAEGMNIRTRSALAEKSQRAIFEFLLANHPLDCPICDKGGECPLQDQTFKFGPGTSRYVEPKRHHVKPLVLGPTIELDRERCVLCWRCVRFCADVAEDKSIVLLDRGDHTIVGTMDGKPYVNNFSGNVVELCPVGALTSRKQRFAFRPWELQNRPSICPHCPMGCNINISVRKNDEVIRFLSRDNPEVDNSWLCDRGRFGIDFIDTNRLTSPLIRRENAFEQVSWPEAFDHIVAKLQPVLEVIGPEAVAGVASPRLTNEDLFVFKRFINDVIGSPNVDHWPRARRLFASADSPARLRLDDAVMPYTELERVKTIVLLGANPSERMPVLELTIRRAINDQGAKLLVLAEAGQPAESRAGNAIALSSKATTTLTYERGRFAEAVRNHADILRRPADRGSPADLLTSGPVAVVYDEGFWGEPQPGDALNAVMEYADALGSNLAGVIPLLDDCNSMGARDLELVGSGANRGLIKRLGTGDRTIRAAFIAGAKLAELGQDMVASLADLDLLVVQELTLTDTAKLADVVLPAASFAEKQGTFTNAERRIQMLQECIPAPGIARPDWQILVDLSQLFDVPLEYASPEDVWNDIRANVPRYSGVRYLDIGPRGKSLARHPAMSSKS